MAEATGLKLIMEKGPREGETLKYSSGSTVKIGRVVRGNTIAIKDAGISSKHICIQFDTHLSKWTLIDLDSSNGTVLNGQILKPYVPSALDDGDCIKIGELTSIIVKIEIESPIRPRRNPRRQAKAVAAAGPADDVKKEAAELELGFDGGNDGVQKRNLRNRGKKGADLKNEVQISENLNVDNVDNVDAVEVTDHSVLIEPKRTRGRKKLPVQVPEDPDFDQGKAAEIAVPGKRTRGGRRGLRVEPLKDAQSGCLEENLNNANIGSSHIDEGNEEKFDKLLKDSLKTAESSGLEENLNNANDNGSSQINEGNEETVDKTCDKLLKDSLESVKESTLGDNLDTNKESAKEHVVDESCLKGKEVAEEELECKKDGCPDNGQWLDLEKMTLSDFFDYLEVQLPKEIYDKSEKIISDMKEKARKCHEFRRQRNKTGKGIN